MINPKSVKHLLVFLMAFGSIALNAQEYKGVDEVFGLEPGSRAPLFQAMDADSNQYSMREALVNGPVVLIFYRGHWCPHCNKHLESIQDSLQYILETGASVVAVSPQKPEYLQKMESKTGVSFTLLYDEGYRIADAYGVTFKPEPKQLFTYIINQDGTITWRQFDPDYKKRSGVADILKALSQQKKLPGS